MRNATFFPQWGQLFFKRVDAGSVNGSPRPSVVHVRRNIITLRRAQTRRSRGVARAPADPECVSPLDNDESSFATGIPGDNKDPCKQDCFFDGNSGMGDDGCEWQLKCDPANIGAGAAASCPYDPSYKNCPGTQSQKCVDKCQAITPNGCDCFGCCAVAGVDHAVRLDATCTASNFGDPTKCPACTQQTSCMKTCDKCQLCLGKTTLDPSCAGPDGGPPTPVCPPDQTVCGTNQNLCPETASCITGCCVPYL
jgi:hypothetical protein